MPMPENTLKPTPVTFIRIFIPLFANNFIARFYTSGALIAPLDKPSRNKEGHART